VLEPLRDGRLCITSVVELAKVITPGNQAEIVPRFFHLSKQQAKEVSAELCPRAAPVREVVTAVRPLLVTAPAERAVAATSGPRASAAPSMEPVSAASFAEQPSVAAPTQRQSVVAATPTTPAAEGSPAASSPAEVAVAAAGEQFIQVNSLRANSSAQVEPLDRDLRRLHITVSRRLLEKIDAARDALSHARPNATTEEILEAALDTLLAERGKRHGQVKKPRAAVQPAGAAEAYDVPGTLPANVVPALDTRATAIPAHVKREVWKRAVGRCEWKLHSGEVCGSTTRLEYDHIVPRARGGASTIDNVRICCRSHNDLAARQIFGDAWMDRFRKTRSTEIAPDR
jgi:hypothetical protein